jgi:hypothetical protein
MFWTEESIWINLEFLMNFHRFLLLNISKPGAISHTPVLAILNKRINE